MTQLSPSAKPPRAEAAARAAGVSPATRPPPNGPSSRAVVRKLVRPSGVGGEGDLAEREPRAARRHRRDPAGAPDRARRRRLASAKRDVGEAAARQGEVAVEAERAVGPGIGDARRRPLTRSRAPLRLSRLSSAEPQRARGRRRLDQQKLGRRASAPPRPARSSASASASPIGPTGVPRAPRSARGERGQPASAAGHALPRRACPPARDRRRRGESAIAAVEARCRAARTPLRRGRAGARSSRAARSRRRCRRR